MNDTVDHRAERDRSYRVADRIHRGAEVVLLRDVVYYGPYRVAPKGTTVTVESVSNAGFRGQEVWFTHAGHRYCVSAGAVDPSRAPTGG